jgi:hypothetical protein
MSVTRRALLGGGLVLGAAAAAAAVSPTAEARSMEPTRSTQPAQPTQPTKRITGPARVGGTFDLFPFAAGTTYPQALRDWNKTTGTTSSCWKVYYQLGQFPTSLDARLTTILHHDIQALISFKPAVNTKSSAAATDKKKLESSLKLFHKAGLTAEVCLWQEVGPKDMTADEYHEYVAYYGPVIRHYYPLVFDAPGYQGPAEWAKYDPGRDMLDGYAVDYYCGDYINRGTRLDKIMELAGPLPVGIWEIGNTASASFLPTASEVTAYLTYITSKLSKRLAKGLPVGSLAWYNGPADGGQSGQNEMVGAHPCKRAKTDLADYKLLYDAVNGKYPA